jgi:hypothetical protein
VLALKGGLVPIDFEGIHGLEIRGVDVDLIIGRGHRPFDIGPADPSLYSGVAASPTGSSDPVGGTPRDPPATSADTQSRAASAEPDASAQRASLDGESPPMLSKPLREMTLAEVIAECNADPGEPWPPPRSNHRWVPAP